ncbi:unnamed protein product [Symbiodinium necroappetens]|uniref:Reverse transcriptase domain-containing protein n=1 Tax=Symbiodinium necroappetens TaxID=1628268 RepID=A0A813CAH5_9DINO|nr:unnamed protein product [Symbiodinium necroappetens]
MSYEESSEEPSMSAEASAGSLSSRADNLGSGSDAGGADAAPNSSNAAQLCARDSSYRSHVQKISAFRRRASGLQPSQLEELLRPQLLEPAATCFTDDLQRLQHLLDAPILPNDMGWILGCDGEGQPPKSLLVQRLQTLLARHFGQVLHYKAAASLAMSMLDILANAWYQELLLTTWPLLGEDGQRSLQTWFWRYRLGAQPEDLRDDSAEEGVNVAAEQHDPAASSHAGLPWSQVQGLMHEDADLYLQSLSAPPWRPTGTQMRCTTGTSVLQDDRQTVGFDYQASDHARALRDGQTSYRGRLSVPEDLLTLIMYIHDHALIVLKRYDLRDSVRLGRGVRQGCGLSPQLWLAFTVLFFDKVSYLPANAVSGFADDFHIQWSIHSACDMHNACSHIPRVIQDLNSLGMNVSADKTVALLALAGADAPKLMKTYTERTPKGHPSADAPATVTEVTQVAADLVDFDMPPTFHRPALQMSSALPDEQLQEAAAELARFSAYMQPSPVATPTSTAPSTRAGETANLLDMELDERPKRNSPSRAEAPTRGLETPLLGTPQKFLKAEGKGDNKGEGNLNQNTAEAAEAAETAEAETDTHPKPAEENKTEPPGPRGKGRSQERQWPTRQERRRQQEAPSQSSKDQQRGGWNWGRQPYQWPNRSDRKGGYQRNEDNEKEAALRKEIKELKNIIRAMGRLTLRIEDRAAVDMLDKEFFLFLQTEASGNEWSVTKRLWTVATEWNRLRETSPEEITQPLRCVLLHAFLTALQSQVTAIETNSQLLQQAKDRGLMQDESYCYLRWDHQERRHLPAPQQPLEHQTLQQCLQLMLRLIVFPNTVGNFHPVRKMTAGLSSEVLPFALVIQNRNQEAQQLYQCCQRLSRNSSLHLVGATMRPAKLGRSPAAVALDKMLQDL